MRPQNPQKKHLTKPLFRDIIKVQKTKEIKIMRLVHYGVFNKETNNRVFTHCRKTKAEEFIAKQANPEKFEIRYKWVSI